MTTRLLPTDEPETLDAAAQEAVALLKQGEIVALPTETVGHGLAAMRRTLKAVAKIFEAEGAPNFDPLIVHLPHRRT